MKIELTNAFPVNPMQDKFGQIVFPMAGLSKLEYFSLEIFKTIFEHEQKQWKENNEDAILDNDIIMLVAIDEAIEFLELLQTRTKNLQDDKNTVLDIVQ